MKPLPIALLVVAMACPLYADNVLLQEGFEGTVGSSVSGWNGWTGDPELVIANSVIDQENSAAWLQGNRGATVSKSFTHSPGKAEQYVFTATLNASDANGSYADVRLAASNAKNAKHVAAQLGYRELLFTQNAIYDETVVRVRQSAATMDARLVISDSHIDCYYRNHGESTWKLAGRLTALNGISTYNTVGIAGDRCLGGGVDSIRLTVEPAGSRQESALQSK